jgi:hypothetical protein
MSGWTPDELRKISHAEELAIAARSPDGTFSRYVTIWVVRAEDDIYVRSAYGSDNPWYRRAMASGEGRIRAGGVEKDVTFGKAADNGQPAIDTAYHAKYDRYGPAIVGSVTGAHARDVTVRLVPKDAAAS